MRTVFVAIALGITLVTDLAAQWTPPTTPGSVTGPIYYNGGNVGIGITAPSVALHVGAVGGNGAIKVGGASGASSGIFVYNSESGAGTDRATFSTNAYYNGSNWSFLDNTKESWLLQLRQGEDDFVVNRAPSGGTAAFTPLLKVQGNGNVGIGTTTASALLTVGPDNGMGNKLTVNGDMTVTGNIGAKFQDIAEWVPAPMHIPVGTVVVLNPQVPNEVMPSHNAYDPTVAGVVSASPGLILGEAGPSKARIATTGRVKVHVDASTMPVHIGDLLVTSDKAGFAMVSQPIVVDGVKIHRPGTLIGKALEPLPVGEGEILVLLSLQ